MALTYAPNVSLLVNNAGGLIQSLPDERVGGKLRIWVERITLAQQTIGDQIQIARLPFGAVPLDIWMETTATLGAAPTVAIGDKNNVSRFSAAGTFTSADARTSKINSTSVGVPLTTAYDNAGVSNTNYEDVLLTIGVSSLPAAGTLTTVIEYLDYGS